MDQPTRVFQWLPFQTCPFFRRSLKSSCIWRRLLRSNMRKGRMRTWRGQGSNFFLGLMVLLCVLKNAYENWRKPMVLVGVPGKHWCTERYAREATYPRLGQVKCSNNQILHHQQAGKSCSPTCIKCIKYPSWNWPRTRPAIDRPSTNHQLPLLNHLLIMD